MYLLGICCVSDTNIPDRRVMRVRKLKKEHEEKGHYTSSSLNDDIVARLDHLGFTWVVYQKGDSNFERHFQELCRYKEKHGHCVVPTKEGTLGRWVTDLRHQYKVFQDPETRLKSKLNQSKIDRLNELGFKWNMQAS